MTGLRTVPVTSAQARDFVARPRWQPPEPATEPSCPCAEPAAHGRVDRPTARVDASRRPATHPPTLGAPTS